MNLSKSRIIAGFQCLKRLYLQIHERELAADPDEGSLAVIEQGQEVGRLARTMFPGGVLIEAGHEELTKALALTQELVARNQAPALFEGTFKHANILVRTDILERKSKGTWRLIEVKSATSVKAHYVYDVAIQRLVLEGCGFKVVPCLMHLNRDYVYDGRRYELQKLFRIEDMTAQTAALSQDVRELIRQQRKMLAQATPPDIEAGPQCTSPVTCEFYDVCNPELPNDHVSHLPGMTVQKLQKLKDLGVQLIGKIPKSFPLTERQKRARDCVTSGKPWFSERLKQRLGELKYPVHFMDFETLGEALPVFRGMRPYDPLPFQWSIHTQRKPGAAPEHYEFLAAGPDDPRPQFAESLCRTLEPGGSVVVYNRGFESGCLSSLGGWVPRYREAMAAIQPRLWDLLEVVRANVYHAGFAGSFSLKSVLPALVPGMSYEGMAVSEGNEAGLAWAKMIRGPVGAEERKRLRSALLAYCRQDTLALVRLLEVLLARRR